LTYRREIDGGGWRELLAVDVVLVERARSPVLREIGAVGRICKSEGPEMRKGCGCSRILSVIR
jgi:hypothetical protein